MCQGYSFARRSASMSRSVVLAASPLVLGTGGGYWLQRQPAERQVEADRHRLGAEQALEKVLVPTCLTMFHHFAISAFFPMV